MDAAEGDHQVPDGTRREHGADDRSKLPVVPELAARLADLHGLSVVVNVGHDDWSLIRLAHPDLRLIDLAVGGPSHAASRNRRAPVSWDLREPLPSLSPTTLGRSALVADVTQGMIQSLDGLPSALARLIDSVPLAILRADDARVPGVLDVLDQAGIIPTFAGRTPARDGRTAGLVIVDRVIGAPGSLVTPEDFRVLAVVTTYNEADIIASTIEALRLDGVHVHVVDNWSTDGTFEIASRHADTGTVTVERYPSEPTPTFDLEDLLRHVEMVGAASAADWVVHHDADERRRAPWAGMTLRAALWAVQRSGFNAINHTVLNFRPIDDGFRAGSDPEGYFRCFELGTTPDLLLQVRAWRTGPRVQLARSGGHEAEFQGRRIFPYRFLLKHYPLRSQAQAERKIFRERRERWNVAERAKGWHVQYDDARPGHTFTWPSASLSEFVEGRSQEEYLLPFIGGSDIGQSRFPRWATGHPLGGSVYIALEKTIRSSAWISLRESRLGNHPLARRTRHRIKRTLLGR